MKKSYCTQNNGDCTTCSLIKYGLDCKNEPVQSFFNPRIGNKESRAMAAYDGFKGGTTVAHVKKLVGKELADKLTGHELGLVMSAVNRTWQEAKASTGAEVIDGEYVWISCLEKGIDLDVLRRLKKVETSTTKKIPYDGNLCDVSGWMYKTFDDMPYNEQKSARNMQYVPRNQWNEWYHIEIETITTWGLE